VTTELRNRKLDQLLLGAKTPEDFLRASLPIFTESQSTFSYAQVARQAGFASRSYVRALFEGKKPLSEAALLRLSSALSLRKDTEQLLLLRLQLRTSLSKEKSRLVLARSRRLEAKIRDRLLRQDLQLSQKSGSVFRVEDWVFVFSALGQPGVGATIEEITQRTRRSRARCEQVLKSMLASGMVEHREEEKRYAPLSAFLNFGELGTDDAFQKFFEAGHRQVGRKINTQFNDPNALFFSSVFSVRRSRLPEITKALQEVLVEFSETFEEAAGDDVVLLQAAMTES
jgi:hypothetical protein